jgi:thiol-disulfide isomerase/thioredoxin
MLLFWSFVFQFLGKSRNIQDVILDVDLSHFVEKPNRLLIERHGLASYAVIADTIKITDAKSRHIIRLEEPELISLVLLWSNGKRRSTSFRAFHSTYQLSANEQQQITLKNTNGPSKLEGEFALIQRKLETYNRRADSLTSLVRYENRSVTAVELEIVTIRDSIENLIDDEVYKKYAISHLNTAAGLYALAKYADRPLERQRRKWQPDYIKILLDQFKLSVRVLPTFKLLNDKLALAKQLSVGNMGKDLSLIDSAGTVIRTKDYRGKYLLIDFWASWCIPCRKENPKLLNTYHTYKVKGFDILSITLDNRNQIKFWKNAIAADKIGIWNHVSDYNNLAQQAYNISVVPSNFLLDRSGKIIAVDLRGDDLSMQLAKIFAQ